MRRWLFRLFALILGSPALFYLAAFLGALVPGGGSWDDAPAQVRIGLLRGLIHYDFLLPLDDALRADYAFAQEDQGLPLNDSRAEWLALGWGSEAFYTTAGSYADIRLAAVWQAATGDAAVIRLDVMPHIPRGYEAVTWLDLSKAQYDALLQGIAASFARDAAGKPQPHPAPGFTGSDSFWLAEGHFDLTNPCNQWLGEQLRAAGVPFGRWTPTPQSVALSLWWNARPEG